MYRDKTIFHLLFLLCGLQVLTSCRPGGKQGIMVKKKTIILDETECVIYRKPKYFKITPDSLALLVANETELCAYSLQTGKIKFRFKPDSALLRTAYDSVISIGKRKKPEYDLFSFERADSIIHQSRKGAKAYNLLPYFDYDGKNVYLLLLLNIPYSETRNSHIVYFSNAEALITLNSHLNVISTKIISANIKSAEEYKQLFSWPFSGFFTNGNSFMITGYNTEMQNAVKDIGSYIAKFGFKSGNDIELRWQIPVRKPNTFKAPQIPFLESHYHYKRINNNLYISNGDSIFDISDTLHALSVSHQLDLKGDKIFDFLFSKDHTLIISTNGYRNPMPKESIGEIYLDLNTGASKKLFTYKLTEATIIPQEEGVFELRLNKDRYSLTHYAIE